MLFVLYFFARARTIYVVLPQIRNNMFNITLCVQLTKVGLRISTYNLLQQETIENNSVLLLAGFVCFLFDLCTGCWTNIVSGSG